MSKKASVHNHITNLYSLEIDYDKLADAIIKAQSTNTETPKSELQSTEKPLIKKIILFIQLMTIPETLKRRKDLSGTTMLFSSFSAVFMIVIGVILSLISLAMLYILFTMDVIDLLGVNIFPYLVGLLVSYIVGIMLRISAQEISNIEDLTVVSMIFTCMVSFIAMVASVAAVVISLRQGV